jgi:hypothetical protein
MKIKIVQGFLTNFRMIGYPLFQQVIHMENPVFKFHITSKRIYTVDIFLLGAQ